MDVEIPAVRDVFFAQGLRQKQLYGLTDKFMTGIAEKPFHLAIGDQNAATLIDDEDGVGSGFQDLAELLLALFQGCFCLPAFRNISNDRGGLLLVLDLRSR